MSRSRPLARTTLILAFALASVTPARPSTPVIQPSATSAPEPAEAPSLLPPSAQPSLRTIAPVATRRPNHAVAARPVPAADDKYRIGKMPAWVKPVAAALSPSTGIAAGTAGAGFRALLLDRQVMLTPDGRMQDFTRTRMMAVETAALPAVSKAEIAFNPAFQTLTLHEAAVWRDGVRVDRLKGASIQLLRREEGLESEMLTGMQSLLVVLNDVRVGDAVDVSYTVTGRNPIFKGHFSENFGLTNSVAIDHLHLRVDSPRALHVRGIRSDAVPETFAENGLQVLRVDRRDVPAVIEEEGTPAWFKAYPSLHVSDYADWNEVARWADDLFADPGPLGPELTARLDALAAASASRAQLASDVLEIVQDEVRYFSASLGESSHRPKPPGHTWSDRLGDCKDKTALLVASLRHLGFDARPALVSTVRNKGIASYLPSHDEFDHVIALLTLDGHRWWLDGTLQKQGRRLESRGYIAYGTVLEVARDTQGLTTVDVPTDKSAEVEYDQRWDLSKPDAPVRLTTKITAHGLAAEGWRGAIAAGGLPRIAQGLAGNYARLAPDIRSVGTATIADDRDTNTFVLAQSYEVPTYGDYDRGNLTVEAPALDMLDWLRTPREARREFPWFMGDTHRVVQRVRVISPRGLLPQPPKLAEVGDRHFSFTQRSESNGSEADFTFVYERRQAEVLPQELSIYRDRIQAARKLTSPTVRLALVDFDLLEPALTQAIAGARRVVGTREDALSEAVIGGIASRTLTTAVLQVTGDSSPLGATVLARRVAEDDVLGDYAGTLADAERGLKIAPANSDLHYARGLALLAADRPADALAAFDLAQNKAPSQVQRASGITQVYLGQPAEAQQRLRDVVEDAVGSERDEDLLWLWVAAEHAHRDSGKSALAPYLDTVDPMRWPGVLVRHLVGLASADDVMRAARKDSRMERFNLVEADFYLGQEALLRGDAALARTLFQHALDIGATPYLENMLARVELDRLAAR
jgi:lipoprotein NlpI/transglutaminase-like putative cysteine protease